MVSTAFGSPCHDDLACWSLRTAPWSSRRPTAPSPGTTTSYLKGEKTSTNPIATIFAWSGGLKRRGELDGLPELVQFGQALEDASLETLKDGVMTKDLLGLVEPGFQARGVDSEEFLDEIAKRLADKLAIKGDC